MRDSAPAGMKPNNPFLNRSLARRAFLTKAMGAAGSAATLRLNAAEPPTDSGADYLKELEENERKIRSKDAKPMIGLGDKLKITKVETIFVKPRWLFLKIHTNAGITGLGEGIVEGRAKTVATAIEELTPYLIGKDPRPVAHHWQAMYRHAFYRGGPILTSAISGVDQALWDIKGKALGVPVYELLGGPTRARARAYAHAGTVERIKQRKAEGFTAFKTAPFKERPARIVENKAATILQPDLCHAGGLTECRLIAGMAEAFYAAIAPHNPLGPISLAAGLHLAAAIPNFLCQEQSSLGVGYIKKPFQVRDGYIDIPTGPGLGIELDENALANKLDHDWRNRETYDADDGSVVDW